MELQGGGVGLEDWQEMKRTLGTSWTGVTNKGVWTGRACLRDGGASQTLSIFFILLNEIIPWQLQEIWTLVSKISFKEWALAEWNHLI